MARQSNNSLWTQTGVQRDKGGRLYVYVYMRYVGKEYQRWGTTSRALLSLLLSLSLQVKTGSISMVFWFWLDSTRAVLGVEF